MTVYSFNTTADGWSETDMAFDGTDGYPSAGCLSKSGTLTAGTASISGLSLVVQSGDFLSFRYKIVGTLGVGENLVLTAKDGGGSPLGSVAVNQGFESYNDWYQRGVNVLSPGTVASLEFSGGGGGSSFSFMGLDLVCVAETEPVVPSIAEIRYLGMDMDNTYLYITSIRGGTLTMEYAAFTDLTAGVGTSTFGTCDFADPDTYTRAVYPVTISDQVLYLYGRDANDVQVQYNDLNGTVGWQNYGPGTATWATGKFCVAMMPHPFAIYNLVAVFADDDIYHTVAGSTGWVKEGDGGTALRTAGQVTTEFGRILVAGQGTAEMYYSQNYGVSFTNAYSGLAGTINAIEVSR